MATARSSSDWWKRRARWRDRRSCFEFVEENCRHIVIEMLPRMGDHLLNLTGLGKGATNYCRLYKLRSRTDNCQNFELAQVRVPLEMPAKMPTASLGRGDCNVIWLRTAGHSAAAAAEL